MATKKFSPAQIAAQKLFAERARAGTLGKGKRKANPDNSNKPMAAKGLTSYRYRGRYGYIMIGAEDDKQASREAQRSSSEVVTYQNLEVWNGKKYVPVVKPNPGLYDNINAKRARIAAGSGERMRKPGQAGRPTAEAFEQSAMTAKRNPITETLIYGLAPGETRDYMEELMYAGGQKLTQAQIDKVFKAASDAGYHSFRVTGFDPTMKPDFAAAVRRKRNPAPKFSVGDTVKFSMDVLKRTDGQGKNARGVVISLDSKIPYAAVDFQGTWIANEETGSTIRMVPIKNLAAVARKTNPDKSKPRAYVKRASQATGAPPSKRLQTRRKMALKAPAGYFPNPKAAMMTGYQVICMHPKKHVVGIFKTMAEAKLVARAMADAKNVPCAVKTVKVHKTHFAV